MLQGKPKVTLTLPMPSGTLPQCPQSCCKRAWRKSKHQNDDMAGRSFSLARTRRKKKKNRSLFRHSAFPTGEK